MATTALQLLRIFLMIVGGLVLVWGIYDMFGEGGNQSSVGVKKIVGGVAFMVISYFLMTWAIDQVQQAQEQAGIGDMAYHAYVPAGPRGGIPILFAGEGRDLVCGA